MLFNVNVAIISHHMEPSNLDFTGFITEKDNFYFLSFFFSAKQKIGNIFTILYIILKTDFKN